MERIRGDFLEMLGQPVTIIYAGDVDRAPMEFKALLAATDIGVFLFSVSKRIWFIPWAQIRALVTIEPESGDIPGVG